MSYDPTVGRFISEDPIAFEGGDANLYRYVGNSPTNFTDPLGLAPNRAGTTDPSHVLDRIRELEAKGMSPDQILATLRDEHADNNNRYFYTDAFGWVDIRHFAEAARRARQMGSVLTEGLGFLNECWQWLNEGDGDYRSGFSPEDLPSNSAGAGFGDDYSGQHGPLSKAFEQWLKEKGGRDQNDPQSGRGRLPATDPSVPPGGGRGSACTSNRAGGDSGGSKRSGGGAVSNPVPGPSHPANN